MSYLSMFFTTGWLMAGSLLYVLCDYLGWISSTSYIRQYGADACWAMAYFGSVLGHFFTKLTLVEQWLLILLPAMWEVAQAYGLVAGTYDVLDLAAYYIPFSLVFINRKYVQNQTLHPR